MALGGGGDLIKSQEQERRERREREEEEERKRKEKEAASHTVGGGTLPMGRAEGDKDANPQISPPTLGGSPKNQAPAMAPLFEASRGGIGRLAARTGFTLWGALLSSAIMSVPGPFGAAVGAITGLYTAYQATKKEWQANPNMPAWQKFARAAGRFVGMTAAGAAMGFFGGPATPFLIGPALVAIDKVCGIGAHPEKNFARSFVDIMGAAIPGAGIVNYLDYRNNKLDGEAVQPVAPYVPKTPPAKTVATPAHEHAVAASVPARATVQTRQAPPAGARIPRPPARPASVQSAYIAPTTAAVRSASAAAVGSTAPSGRRPSVSSAASSLAVSVASTSKAASRRAVRGSTSISSSAMARRFGDGASVDSGASSVRAEATPSGARRGRRGAEVR